MRDRVPLLPGSASRAGRPLAGLLTAVLAAPAAVLPSLPPQGAPEVAAQEAAFRREVLPGLRAVCWECHGAERQKGGLRLDSREALLAGGDSGPVLVPGRPEASELLRRVQLPREDEEAMPARGTPLSPREVESLRAWVAAGAPWPEAGSEPPHWAYVPPERPPLPTPRDADWGRTPVDAFVRTRLEAEGLVPAPEAGRAELLRRLTLDLIGLPPTPEEVAAFEADARPEAYERQVERLLASPQFGVRWARPWLDAARYADSHGYQADNLRDLWAYRDWVVDALNADMPFDRFTVEQLAGDLLPGATAAQRIATGFNRAAPCNVELGSDPEETRVNQVLDRVNTLGTVWLGTTMACAQCHDHKYDPFTTRDYYGLYAFFNQTAIEAERAKPDVPGSIRFLGPEMELPDPEVERDRERLQARIVELDRRLEERRAELAPQDPAWEQGLRARAASAPREHVLAVDRFECASGSPHELLPDGSILLGGEAPDKDTYTLVATARHERIRGFRLETLTDPSLPGDGPGRGDARRPAFLLHEFEVAVGTGAADAPGEPVRFARASADHSQNRYDVAGAIDGDPGTAWGIGPRFHEPHWALFECAEPLEVQPGTRLVFRLTQAFGLGRTIGRLRLSVVTGDGQGSPVPEDVVALLDVPAEERGADAAGRLLEYRASVDESYAEILRRRRRLAGELGQMHSPTTLVMRAVDEPRPTFAFQRGDFRTPGEPVPPGVPAILPPLRRSGAAGVIEASARDASGEERAPDRLDLARWLVRDDNPLVARVVVNRWWAELFGHGLVTTPGDFGVRGDPPTHPELLDWLARELVDGGWSMKRVLRTIVSSATYRQAARIPAELLERDPKNLLYARGPRTRMDAEMIRDNALAVAGLLDPRLGGPPVRPPQPNGLWSKVGGKVYEYDVSQGTDKFRRGLYVVLRRSALYPSFVAFDLPGRMTCQVERERSNTPLQALTLLNDPVYVDAAAALAGRILRERERATPEERVEHAFRLALARAPRPSERAALRRLHDDQLAAASADTTEARALAAEHEPPEGVSPAEFSAWYAVATTLLNLDETITK